MNDEEIIALIKKNLDNEETFEKDVDKNIKNNIEITINIDIHSYKFFNFCGRNTVFMNFINIVVEKICQEWLVYLI